MKAGKALLLIGIIGTSVFGAHTGAQYGRAVWGDRDIWWTPRSLAVDLDETQDEFRLLVSGDLLQEHLRRGSLQATDAQGETYRVVAGDISVRLNNWDEVRASWFQSAVFSAFMLGAAVACLVLGGILIRSARRAASLTEPR
ncbi:MAG: hypothetical protein GF355_13405 [Candidatus Eisenbacteria bacterium]|nr:hypothetical protein [Candidatus Eisenbacteria bacterium]